MTLYSMKDIIDGSGKRMFGPKPDVSSVGAPYTAANPPQVTGNVGFALNSFPNNTTLGNWDLPYNPIQPSIYGYYWELTDPTNIAAFGGIVLKRPDGTIVTNGSDDQVGTPFSDGSDYLITTRISLVEQRTDLSSARVLCTQAIWTGMVGYNDGGVSVPVRTNYIIPWNTPGNNSIGTPMVYHVGFYRTGTNNYYTMDTDTFTTRTNSALTYNGYTWPTPLNGPVSTTLWVP